MKLTWLLTLLLITGNSCAVARPDADLCIVNALDRNRKCYNLKRDYQDDGTLKGEALPVYRSNDTLEDLNKALVLDSPHESGGQMHFEDGIARMKAWVKKLRLSSSCNKSEALR